MGNRLDDIVDEAWRIYDYYRGFFFTGSRRLAIERVATFAYREGVKDQPADVFKEPGDRPGAMKVVVEQHKSLLISLVAAAVGATGSAAVTSSANPWLATGIAWGGTGVAVVVAGVRTWATRG